MDKEIRNTQKHTLFTKYKKMSSLPAASKENGGEQPDDPVQKEIRKMKKILKRKLQKRVKMWLK